MAATFLTSDAQHIELADEIAEDDCAVAGHWSLNLKRSPEMPCANSAVAAGALAHRVLDVLVTQVGLQGTRGQRIAAGMTQLMRMDLEGQPGGYAGPFHKRPEAYDREGAPRSDTKM